MFIFHQQEYMFKALLCVFPPFRIETVTPNLLDVEGTFARLCLFQICMTILGSQ